MAGRVLSKSNESKLRDAMAAISEVLSSISDGAPDAAPDAAAQTEADAGATELEGDYVPLVEAGGVRKDGSALIKIIAPGRGSSGWYSPEVLKRDARVFRRGLQIFIDHPTLAEESERPEGSISRLAGELTDNAIWQDDGPHGAGLYAEAKFFAHHVDAVRALAPSIGMSIRAMGRTVQGKAPDGKTGPIVEELVSARSCDLVTQAGAGGKIVQMFEAARNVAPAPVENQGGEMGKELEEAQAANAAKDAEIAALKESAAKLQEAAILRDARDLVRTDLAATEMPEVARQRLLEQLSANPPTKDGALDAQALQERVVTAIAAEQAYLAAATGAGSGRVVGMGDSVGGGGGAAPDLGAKLAEAFMAFGLSTEEASVAARGR